MSTDFKTIVCRCELVTVEDILGVISTNSIETVNQVKKLTRAGMGPCQGRTCAPVIELLLEREGRAPRGTEPYKARPPVRPLPLSALADQADEFAEPAKSVSKAYWGPNNEDPR